MIELYGHPSKYGQTIVDSIIDLTKQGVTPEESGLDKPITPDSPQCCTEPLEILNSDTMS